MSIQDILTHNGNILITDYIVVIFAAFATIGLQILQTQNEHKDNFKLKVVAHENWIRWIVSLNSALFLLYVIPEGYFWYMEDVIGKEKYSTQWNTLFSAVIGLSPLYLLKKVIKTSRSKFRDIERN